MKLGATGDYSLGKFNETDDGELILAITTDEKAGKVIINFATEIAWVGMSAEQAKGFGELLIMHANQLAGTVDYGLDWDKAVEHFREVRSQYQDLAGDPGVNSTLALQHVFQPLAKRYYDGERTQELFDELMSVE